MRPRTKAEIRIPLATMLVVLTAGIAVNIATAETVEPEPIRDVGVTRTSTPSAAPPPPPTPMNALPAPVEVGSFVMDTADGVPLISNATYDTMPYVTPLNPEGPQETMVRWVDGWGVPPTSAEEGTVYVLGHAWAVQPLVFNPLSEIVTSAAVDKAGEEVASNIDAPVLRKTTDALKGSVVRMTDDHGHGREWVIDSAWMVDKYQAINDEDLMDDTIPGRIILIACSVDGAQDLGYNVVVSGRLKDPLHGTPSSGL